MTELNDGGEQIRACHDTVWNAIHQWNNPAKLGGQMGRGNEIGHALCERSLPIGARGQVIVLGESQLSDHIT